jgi:hypothetical protein
MYMAEGSKQFSLIKGCNLIASDYQLHDGQDPYCFSRESIVCIGNYNELISDLLSDNPVLRLVACSFQNCMI